MRSLIWFWIVAAPAIALFAENRHAGSAAPSDIEKRSVGRRRARRLASGDADGRRRRPLHLARAVTAEELDELSDYFVSDEIGLPLLARNPRRCRRFSTSPPLSLCRGSRIIRRRCRLFSACPPLSERSGGLPGGRRTRPLTTGRSDSPGGRPPFRPGKPAAARVIASTRRAGLGSPVRRPSVAGGRAARSDNRTKLRTADGEGSGPKRVWRAQGELAAAGRQQL